MQDGRSRRPEPTAGRRPRSAAAADPGRGRRRAASGSRCWSGLLVAAWLALQLFASVLLPFVAAAGHRLCARSADDAADPRSACRAPLAALLLIMALIAAGLLFALLLYPLILSQIGILIVRACRNYVDAAAGSGRPRSIATCRTAWAATLSNDKLRDLVGGQAGAMLSFLVAALTHLIGGGFAHVQRADADGGHAGGRVLPAARLAAHGRDDRWLAAAPLRRRDPRPGARGRPHPVGLGARPGDVLPDRWRCTTRWR